MKPPLRVMQIQCCGIREVMSLPGFGRVSKKAFEKWLRYEAKVYHVRVWDRDVLALPLNQYGLWRGGVLMASVKRGQKGYETWLKKVGFKPSIEFMNHNTGNKVKVYFYLLGDQRNV